MPRERKPNEARIRYDRDELRSVLEAAGIGHYTSVDLILDHYEVRRAAGKDAACQSVVYHGPGHQSWTYCQARGGDKGHDHIGEDGYYHPDAPARHVADLPSGDRAEWTDDDPFA